MPSLKMKTESIVGCLREEKNGFRICQKSSIISKNSCCRVKCSQGAAEFDACVQNSQDTCLATREHVQEIGGDKAADHLELLDEGNLQFKKHPSPVSNFEVAGRMESISSTCASIGIQCEPEVNNNAGCDKDLDAPQLGADDSDKNSRSLCEYQTYNTSDFYISDMIVSGLPIESNSVSEDISETSCLPDYRCNEPSMFFDVAEEYVSLPFLDDTGETSSDHEGRTCEDIITDSDDSRLHLAIHQLRSCNEESDVNLYLDLNQSDMFIRNVPDLPDVAANFPSTLIPKDMQKTRSITLVLDLDETLVHSTLEHCENADFTFPVLFNMKQHTVYVKQRPYLRIFLERVAEMFEIVVFTASQSIYAKQLLDIVDPDGKLFSRRAYRESCIFLDGCYTKDLTVLGVDLAKVAIIDNTPQVFQLQVNNGIPITSWFDDPSDSALISLLPFLETLVAADDVRPIIAKKFGNK